MIDTFVCRGCGRSNYFGRPNEINYVFDNNAIYAINGKCNYCMEPFFYESVKGKPLEQFLFLNQNGVLFFKKKATKILCTYTPILKDSDRIKEFTLLNKEEYISVGFNGYEDLVLNKEILGNWYMTLNTNPAYDIFVYSIYLGICQPDVILSYVPSPLLKMNNIDYKYIFDRDEGFYKEESKSIIDVYKELYVGIKR